MFFQLVRRACCLLGLMCLLTFAASGTIRSAVWIVATRGIAHLVPPDYALVGDSRVLDCRWIGRLSWNPLAIVNLAVGGTVLRQIQPQVDEAKALRAKYTIIAGGINDLLIDNAPTSRIAFDFALLMRGLGENQTGVVTLIAYTADPALSQRIDEANTLLSGLAKERTLAVIDLNGVLAHDGVLKPEMTYDGRHFTDRACDVWVGMLRITLSEMQRR
jgi:lysophospholipase L1-like esterase